MKDYFIVISMSLNILYIISSWCLLFYRFCLIFMKDFYKQSMQTAYLRCPGRVISSLVTSDTFQLTTTSTLFHCFPRLLIMLTFSLFIVLKGAGNIPFYTCMPHLMVHYNQFIGRLKKKNICIIWDKKLNI